MLIIKLQRIALTNKSVQPLMPSAMYPVFTSTEWCISSPTPPSIRELPHTRRAMKSPPRKLPR